MSDFSPPDRPPQPLPSPGARDPRSRRTPLLVALGTAAAAALIIGGVAVGSGGGDDDSAPAPTTIQESQETSDPTALPSPTRQPAPTPSTTPAPTAAADTTTTTTAPAEVDTDPSAVAAANIGVLAEQEQPPCPVDAATLAALADGLGGSPSQQEIRQDQLSGTTMFRRRLTKAAAIACVTGTREKGVALYLGPLGDSTLQAWTNEALLNDNARLRGLRADGDATVVAVDSSTEVANFRMAQKGAAWTDGTVVVMSVAVSVGGQPVDADPAAAGAALVEAVPGIVTQLAAIGLPASPSVPSDEPIDTSTALTKVVAITERGRSSEPMECPVSIAVLDAFNEPVHSTFVNRILDESSGIMGARVELYRRRGPTVLRCSAGVENGLVSIYLGRLQGAAPGEWLSMIEPALQYKEVGTAHQGTLLAVRVRQPSTAIHGAAWTDGDLILMIAAVGSPKKIDFTPDQAATGLSPALQATVAELQAC